MRDKEDDREGPDDVDDKRMQEYERGESDYENGEGARLDRGCFQKDYDCGYDSVRAKIQKENTQTP